MATKALTSKELYEIYKAEVIARGSDIIDFAEGSMNDIDAGAMTTAINEAQELLVSEFLKTFFGSANGDDLEILAIDRFGSRFARPSETQSTVDVTFSRPTTAAGNVTIPAGTIIKTSKDASGQEVRFSTSFEVVMTGLSVVSSAISVGSGANTKVGVGKINVIESALTDTSIVVTNDAQAAGGEDKQSDDEYRETIRSLVESLAGATEAAIKGSIQALPEITYVSVVTILMKVREVDDGGTPIGDIFRIPYVRIYVADADGNFSQSLLTLAENVIYSVRAAGVKIEILGALSTEINWTASITLNPAGPNYAELSNDTSKIKEDMANYLDNVLDVGDGFVRSTANSYILSIWGPAGTGDLTSFTTSIPTGNVAGAVGTKLVSGTMETI